MHSKNIAIVSDQLTGGIGGAESILFLVHELFPNAPIYTTVLDKNIIPEEYKNADFRTTFIQHLPYAKSKYKAYFPLMPLAIEYLNLQDYDVIFSSHHCVAKGVISRPDAYHISYCHSPARYIWDLFWTYSDLNGFTGVTKLVTAFLSHYIRMWDVSSSNRVDLYLANSNYTASRIKKFYNRDCQVLFPPVDTNIFNNEGTEDYYLMAGRLVAYKGFELAVDAFNESGKNLVIIGDGAEFEKLKAKAKPNIKLLGRVDRATVIKYMNKCRGFIFPGKEDFGIVMAEAQAAGNPVIAYNAGGALDIVINNETGILFEEQTTESLNKSIEKAELTDWNSKFISEHSKKFDREVFKEQISHIISCLDDVECRNLKPYKAQSNQLIKKNSWSRDLQLIS